MQARKAIASRNLPWKFWLSEACNAYSQSKAATTCVVAE